MNYIEVDARPHVSENVSPHSERTYTAQQIAEQHNVSAVTVRTRWFEWLCKVAPEKLLKNGKSYTELANTLFGEFASVDKKERPLWVADAKQRYSHEWGAAGVIDCEVMPDNVGGTLALMNANNTDLQQSIALQLASVEQFIDQMNAADANLSQAQVQQSIARGTQQAIAEFQLEETTKAQVLNQLRQRRMGGGAS